MLVNIIVWILLGALAGWIASLIMRTDEEMGATANIVVGIVGAFIGGLISRLFGGPSVTGFNLTSLIIAILGAVVLLFLVRMFSTSGTNRPMTRL